MFVPASITVVRTRISRSLFVVITGVVGGAPLVSQHRTPTGPSHVIVCTCIGFKKEDRKKEHGEPVGLVADWTTGGDESN